MSLWGGIEAGGTKFVCALADDEGGIVEETTFPTTTPDETLGRAISFFQQQDQAPAAVGIASFGPVDPAPGSSTYGHVTTTPKPGWANVDVAGPVGGALGVPVGFDTDVNGAALGEHRWGAARGLDSFVYLTVGTGIGGGAMAGGQLVHGLVHPEMGHVRLPRDPEDDFAGTCPFHGDCLEGMASGPAIEARWGQRAETLPPGHPAWALEAHYLALALVNLVCTLSPQRIILGGGVMQQAHLFPMIRRRVQALLNGYVQAEAILERIDGYIVPPGLGSRAGVLGAVALGQRVVRTTAEGANAKAQKIEL